MKIIIAGDGKLGATLTRQLSSSGYDITLIDAKKNVLENSMERYDVLAIQGNCVTMTVLEMAGVKDADLLIAATGADETNLLCCATAHVMNPKLHTIARIRNPEYYEQIYTLRDLYGLSLVVNPDRQAAIEIGHLLKYPGFLKREGFAKGRVEIVELRIDSKSKLCNIALNDMYRIVRCKVLVCTVLRCGKAIIPDGNFVLREGDRIFVTAPANHMTILLKYLGIITRKVKRVILCGGGKISYYLAQQLEKSGMTVQLIEQKQERCLDLAERLPNTSIIHGDASSQYLLDREGLASCDALVTLTGMDELNMFISMYGSSCGVPQVITKLDHIEPNDMVNNLSIGSVISPKDLCCNTIVRYVRAIHNQTGAAISIHTIADGKAEAVEFEVNESTNHCGQPLKELKIKKGVLIACISREGMIEIPNGESSFRAGDMVIIVSSGGEVLYQMNDIFAN
ncbi:MAG: Trk system potassium transporter TrkA [Blautia sp.]|nr:Trk system potassium transporter TrkA [Blautia sp.]MDY5031619.1 Trk system potassium transporter TrkA [Blautia sp.]